MKVLAMYLPQFHRVKENDEWWGDGFTEWTTVKAAKPLFDGHAQPVVPYEENYYDLTKKTTMQWQADLMKQYGIDGVCMYHYWFKDGRKILEKPAENLLQWKDIDMPFCFCWANETWARTWSGLQDANVWVDTSNKKTTEGKSILLDQKYGEEKEWEEHFYYLLSFFKDKRYIKVNNRPLFMIYRPELMPCVERMLYYWDKLAKKEGFSGIYKIGGATGGQRIHDEVFDKIALCEPAHGIKRTFKKNDRRDSTGMPIYDYCDVWESILQCKEQSDKVLYGAFVGYDDTPRRGKKGVVTDGAIPVVFERFFAELLAKNEVVGNKFVFLNAWNEWGEGMHLEPETKQGFAYLEAVKRAKNEYRKYMAKYQNLEVGIPTGAVGNAEGRYKHYFCILDKWLSIKESGGSLASYLLKRGYRTVGLYGYGPLAIHMENELKNSDVSVNCIIDKNKEQKSSDVPVFHPDEVFPEVDVILITATFSSGVIFEGLLKKGIRNVISLEEIIMEYE